MQSMIANLNRLSLGSSPIGFDMEQDYLHQDELYGLDGRPKTSSDGYDADDGSNKHFGPQWVVLKFDQPVTAPEDALVIGAKFDTDPHGEACRLAFYGRVVSLVDLSNDKEMQRLKVHKMKERQGQIERILPDGTSAVCKGFFKKESDITAFVGLKVVTGLGEQGVIESSFGKSGKFRVSFSHGIDASKGRTAEDNVLTLHFKRRPKDWPSIGFQRGMGCSMIAIIESYVQKRYTSSSDAGCTVAVVCDASTIGRLSVSCSPHGVSCWSPRAKEAQAGSSTRIIRTPAIAPLLVRDPMFHLEAIMRKRKGKSPSAVHFCRACARHIGTREGLMGN
eukprot:gene15848-21975_t